MKKRERPAAAPLPDAPVEDPVIKAALLDEKNVFLRIVELRKSGLTERHLPQITTCDLAPGRFRWVKRENEFGGTFVDVRAIERFSRPDFDKAFADLVAAVEASGVTVPESTKAWIEYAGKRQRRVPAKERK